MEKKAITAIRILAAEAIQKANSGHPGMVIGSAPAAYTVWKTMKHNPKDPTWPARDRFVLSSGHASMLEYALLHFFGYGLSIDEIKNFRQLDSRTPGHPEYGHTRGVEATTGPLGQGFAMAVGMAMAETHLAAKYNREGYPVVDNNTYVLMGDGCMMEGIVSEAASMAGTMKLGRLIALYDSNDITIEGNTNITFREDVGARFRAFGWHVQMLEDGEDTNAIENAVVAAKAVHDQPSLIIIKTTIGRGTPVAGKAKAHGEPLGEANLAAMKEWYGWTEKEPFKMPDEVYAHFAELTAGMDEPENRWNAMFSAYRAAYPELADQWDKDHALRFPEELLSDEAFWSAPEKAATRATSGDVLNRLSTNLSNMFGGSADLAPSNKTNLKEQGDYGPDNYLGSNIHFGVRELAMAAACNGIALYGGLRTFCATFFVFSDYVKPALRLSALMQLPVLYILTHDSIGVGEDGPTHQPIEQLAALRAVPNTLVFRPADGRETAAAYLSAMRHAGPTALALSRQNLPLLANSRSDAMRGAYILRDPKGEPDVILMASGSEVSLIFQAADILAVQGYTARVVSVPCMELFETQTEEYRNQVLPKSIRARVAVEAGASQSWYRYVGLDGEIIGLDHFGASAPAEQLFRAFGFTPEHVAEVALSVIGKNR